MAEELKACPFCGGRAEAHKSSTQPYRIRCSSCHAMSSVSSHIGPESPSTIWNTRAPAPEPMIPARIVQIQAVAQHGAHNHGEHVQLFALFDDGTVRVKYFSSGGANVPTDGAWYPIDAALSLPGDGERQKGDGS